MPQQGARLIGGAGFLLDQKWRTKMVMVMGIAEFRRVNGYVQNFYAMTGWSADRPAVSEALEAVYSAQCDALDPSIPEPSGMRLLELNAADQDERLLGGQHVRWAARWLESALEITTAEDGTQFLEFRHWRVLAQVQIELWQWLAGPGPMSRE